MKSFAPLRPPSSFLYDDHSTLSSLLQGTIDYLGTEMGATLSLLYFEEESILWEPSGEKTQGEQAEASMVLAATFAAKAALKVPPIIRPPDLGDLSYRQVSRSVFFAESASPPISKRVGLEDHTLLVFESRKLIFCRGFCLLFIPSDRQRHEAVFQLATEAAGDFLDRILPILEALHRRESQQFSAKLLEAGRSVLTGEPGTRFSKIFSQVADWIGAEGASLFVKGVGDHPESIQLVATHPKKIPLNRMTYPSDPISPTTYVLGLETTCQIPDVKAFRTKLGLKSDQLPFWADVEELNHPRSLLFAFYRSHEDTLYLLRSTNSTTNPSRVFHVLDSLRANQIVPLLSLLHRAMENEYRAMHFFLDSSHELRQRLTGIRSGASYVQKSLARNLSDEFFRQERIHKLNHIVSTADGIVKILERFRYPLPTLSQASDDVKPFRPYADLVRPVCELFLQRARSRRLTFDYHGTEQLGLVYSNLDDWKQVVENIVNNAVKYTFAGQDILIAFERLPQGGGKIHFASESLPITEEEGSFIFDFKYRTPLAEARTEEGDGIGLSICRWVVQRYGGRIDWKKNGTVNVFTVLLPKHLFRPGLPGELGHAQ